MKDKSKNILNTAVFIFIAILVFLVLLYYKCLIQTVPVFSEKGADYGVLEPLNLNAQKSCVKNGQTAFYKFSDIHKILIKKTFDESGNVSCVFRVTVKFPSGKKLSEIEKLDNINLKIGFLSKNDFNKKGLLSFSKENHPVVSCNLKNTIDYEKLVKTYDISFALPFDKFSKLLDEKEGIFIQSDVLMWLQNLKVSSVYTGFDVSGDIPFYGFSSNGGMLDFLTDNFDFTGSSNVFPVIYSENNFPPEISIKMKQPEDDDKINFSFSFGGENLNVNRLDTVTVSSMALKNPFSYFAAKKNADKLLSVLMHNDKNFANDSEFISPNFVWKPIKTDPGLILDWPKDNWRIRDYELFEWDRIPKILFFDTRNYEVQSRFFARIAFFIEKEGFKGKLLSNEELQGKHDYNAHDYSSESFAKFFNKAFFLNFRLNPEEELLLEILVRNGILERTEDPLCPYEAKGGAVLSVSREIPRGNRRPLLAHEGWHTIYFTDEEFRNYVSAVYGVMDSKSMAFLIDYFKSQPSLGYDVSDDYLMQNEFMAYILQNQTGAAGSYFVNKAKLYSVKKFTPELCDYIMMTGGSGFDDCQAMLESFLYEKYNLKSGNIGLCSY